MKRKRSALVVFFLMSISVFLMSACKKEKRAQWYKGAKLSATVVNDRTPPEFTVKLTWPRALYGEVLGYVVERDGEALQQVQELEYKTLASSNHVYTVYALELKGHKSERLRVEVAAPQMRAIGGKAGTIEKRLAAFAKRRSKKSSAKHRVIAAHVCEKTRSRFKPV